MKQGAAVGSKASAAKPPLPKAGKGETEERASSV